MKNPGSVCLFIMLICIGLEFKTHATSKRQRHEKSQPSRSLKRKLQTIQNLFTHTESKGPRKLADPFTDLVYTGHKILESSIYSDTQYQNISAGKIGMVLPRDAPTMVVNELPLQRFYLNGRNSMGNSSPHFTGLQMSQRILEAIPQHQTYSNGFI